MKEDLALLVRKNIDCPIFKKVREQVAYKLSETRGYDEAYAWECAGILIEEFSTIVCHTIGQVYDYANKKDMAKDVLDWANER